MSTNNKKNVIRPVRTLEARELMSATGGTAKKAACPAILTGVMLPCRVRRHRKQPGHPLDGVILAPPDKR